MLNANQKLTSQQYLKQERLLDSKHEFIDSELSAMVGASRKHNLISTNIVRRLGNHLQGLYATSMQVI